MGKFFHINLEQAYQIEKMIVDRDSSRDIVLRTWNGYADVVRYNSHYGTAVFITIPEDLVKKSG